MSCIVQFQKIAILPPRKVYCLASPLPPGNSSLLSYIASKNLAFKTPLPLRISNDLLWGGYGYFLEPHIVPQMPCQSVTRWSYKNTPLSHLTSFLQNGKFSSKINSQRQILSLIIDYIIKYVKSKSICPVFYLPIKPFFVTLLVIYLSIFSFFASFYICI